MLFVYEKIKDILQLNVKFFCRNKSEVRGERDIFPQIMGVRSP